MATKKVNIDIIARDKSKNALNKIRGNLDGVKRSVFNLRNAFVGLGAGLAIRSLVNTGKEIENLQVRLKFLFGTAEEGAKAFDEMAKFASKVPFSLEQIQAGSGVLAVVSKDAEELAKNMELTGNIAAVTGLDFKTTAEQIQRSLSAGIGAADLFRDRGVKAMLGFKAGAKVSIEETREAFERVFGAGGEFAGATDELAQTLEGTLSMIGDKVFNFKRTLLDAGFFAELKTQFGDLNKSMEKNSETLDKIAVTIGTALAVAVAKTGELFALMARHSDKLLFALKGLVALKIGFMLIRWGRALIPIIASMRAIVSLSGVGLALVASSVAASALAYTELGKALDEIEEKIKNNFEQQKLLNRAVKHGGEEFLKVTQESINAVIALNEEVKIQKDTFELFSQKHTMSKAYQDLNAVLDETQKKLRDTRDLLQQKWTMSNEYQKNQEKNLRKETQSEIDLLAQKRASSKDAISIFKTEQEMRMALNDHMQTSSMNTMKMLSGMNKKAFEAYKAMQIARAIIDTYTAATAAFVRFGGWPLGAMAAAASVAQGMAMVAMIKSQSYSGRQQGGMVKAGQPYMVGEAGKEMFIPNQSGKIVPNHELGQPVNVNFNITTVDASGFNQLLNNSRGTIVNMINSAVNETGRKALV